MKILTIDFPNRGLAFRFYVNESVAPAAGTILINMNELEFTAYHAKRDGQVIFIPIDALANCPIESPQHKGNAGDVFLFPGDAASTGRERSSQLLIVYGPDNVFLEPFDRGFNVRSYGLVGRLDQLDRLRTLGESLYRRGSERVRVGRG
jgi:hypothetical protein